MKFRNFHEFSAKHFFPEDSYISEARHQVPPFSELKSSNLYFFPEALMLPGLDRMCLSKKNG
jgi:hypothetical protein